MPWKTSCYKVQRWRFIEEYLRKRNKLAELCRRWSISRKTAYKWISRFKERGRFGLANRRRVAHRIANRPAELWLAAFGAGEPDIPVGVRPNCAGRCSGDLEVQAYPPRRRSA